MSADKAHADNTEEKRDFATTHWSVVLTAGNPRHREARNALTQLCQTYWYPVYAYVRRRVPSVDEAQDLTQEFFAHLIEKNTVGAADPTRGRFRAFLLTALKNFLANQWQKAHAQKRGGDRKILSLDFPAGETQFAAVSASTATADQLFEKEWAISLLDHVVSALRDEYIRKGKQPIFETLKGTISANEQAIPYAQAAHELGISENATQVAVHRLRKRYRELLRREIGQTVCESGEVDDEIRSLISAFSSK